MPDTIEPNVGARIRSLRDEQGYSLRALAERSGLSVNAISLIERGENSPTVSSLHRLAKALNVPITDFFHEESKQSVVYVRRQTGLRSESEGVTMESLGIGLTNQKMEPFCMMIEPGVGNVDDPISHSGEEFVYCLEGMIEYAIEDQIYRLEQGDSLLFDATQNHAYQNVSDTPATVLLVFQAARDGQRVQRLHMEGLGEFGEE